MSSSKGLAGNAGTSAKMPKARSEFAGTRVVITEYDKGRHRVKVIDAVSRLPLEQDFTTETALNQRKPFESPSSKVIKTLAAAGSPIMEVNDNYSSLRGNPDYGFFSYRQGGGNIVKGPISLATEPHQIKISGISTFNPLITSGFPSTIVTPIPTCVWSLPAAAAIQPLLKDVTIMATLVSAMGV